MPRLEKWCAQWGRTIEGSEVREPLTNRLVPPSSAAFSESDLGVWIERTDHVSGCLMFARCTRARHLDRCCCTCFLLFFLASKRGPDLGQPAAFH